MRLPTWLTRRTILRDAIIFGLLCGIAEWSVAEGLQRSAFYQLPLLLFNVLIWAGVLKLLNRGKDSGSATDGTPNIDRHR